MRKSNFLSALDLSNAVSKGVKDNFLLVRTAEELDSESEESEDSVSLYNLLPKSVAIKIKKQCVLKPDE